MTRAALVAPLLAACFQAPAPQVAQGPYPPANVPDYQAAVAASKLYPTADKPPEVAADNPARGGTAKATRNVTPIGWHCEPDQSWTVELSKSGGKLCLDVLGSDVVEDGRQGPASPPPIHAQLRVDGVDGAVFELAPEGTPSRYSRCHAGSTGSDAEQWVIRYKGCVAGSGLTRSAKRADLLFPKTSTEPFLTWTFSPG